jgi:hypothetical protein
VASASAAAVAASSSSSSSSAAAVVAEPAQLALVLGMAFLAEDQARLRTQGTRTSTSASPVRDRERLLVLENNLRWTVLSACDSVNVEECEGRPVLYPQAGAIAPKHVQCRFGQQAAKELAQAVRRLRASPRALDAIMLDYVRFPSVYLTQAYVAVFKEMIPLLVGEGVVDAKTQIYAIAAAPIIKLVMDAYQAADPFNRSMAYNVKYIPSHEYPLYMATQTVITATPEEQRQYTNESGTAQAVNQDRPFLLITVDLKHKLFKQAIERSRSERWKRRD